MNRDPFPCWYTVAEAAARLGVSSRTVARAVEADMELRGAARFLFGKRRVPWPEWESFFKRQPGFEFEPRMVPPRRVEGREVGEPVRARSLGELRRRAGEEAA